MATQGDQPHFLDAVAKRRLEYLLWRGGGGECDGQSVSRPQASWCSRDRSADVARAADGIKPGRSAANEYVFETLFGAAGLISVEKCADYSLRSHSHRQMVLCEFQ